MSGLSFHWLRRGNASGSSPLLSIQKLRVKVGIREVLKDMNLDVHPGDHIRVTGPNGCGKSTLFNAIAGVEPARVISGRVFLKDRDITTLPAHERACAGIVFMRQSNNVFETLTVEENLRLALGSKGPSRLVEKLPVLAREIPARKTVGLLSGGQKKKLAWAMSVLSNGILHLFDEPDAGVCNNFILPKEITALNITHATITENST